MNSSIGVKYVSLILSLSLKTTMIIGNTLRRDWKSKGPILFHICILILLWGVSQFEISNSHVKSASHMLAHHHQILACIFQYLACWSTYKIPGKNQKPPNSHNVHSQNKSPKMHSHLKTEFSTRIYGKDLYTSNIKYLLSACSS